MSLAWPASADVPALPVPPSQLYPLPLPPAASALPLAAPPPASLPVPAPPSLDSARLKLALDKTKLELESTREALDELRALVRDAGAALRAEADERGNALEQQVVSAVRDSLSSQLAPLRSSLSSLSDQLAALSTHSPSDCEGHAARVVKGAVRDAEQRLRAVVQGVERGWAGELARAQDEARAEVRALKERVDEAERRAESEKAWADGLEERVGKVDGEVSTLRRLIEERAQTATPTPHRESTPLAHAHTVALAHNLLQSGQPSLEDHPRAQTVLLASTLTSTAKAQATTSSDSPAPSPPRKRRRRLFPSDEWQATADWASTGALKQQQEEMEQGAQQPRAKQSSSLPLIVAGSEGGRSTNDPAATQRARSAPSGPGAATSTKSGLVRSSTKRRVIEQDESLPEQAEEQERDERGEQVKRRRMIEQDATPAGTQDEPQGGDAGGVAWVGGEDEEEEEEGEEPETLE